MKQFLTVLGVAATLIAFLGAGTAMADGHGLILDDKPAGQHLAIIEDTTTTSDVKDVSEIAPEKRAEHHAEKKEKRLEKKAARKAHKKGRLPLMDSDEDGLVTRDEFMQFHTERFIEADVNNDGAIDQEEAQNAHKLNQERAKKQRAAFESQRKKHIEELKNKLEELESSTNPNEG